MRLLSPPQRESPMADGFPPELVDEVRLSAVRGVGPLIRMRLVEAIGSASKVLAADPRVLTQVPGVGPALSTAICEAPPRDTTREMLAAAAEQGIRVLTPDSEDYPRGLLEIPDPPAVLYCRGAWREQDQRAVAIVGTRRATRYGLRQAELLARGLAAAGVTIVSGLARGVDGVAHRAALESGGRTIASLAGGLSRIYPPEHTDLAAQVATRGALLAEAPPSMPPMSGSFPQRNRIISGLSRGVLVIEAAERSGALITARHAAEQGRDAYAVPGPIDSVASRGCHRLIQQGAKLVTCVEDVLEEIDSFFSHPPIVPAMEQPPTPIQVEWNEPDGTVFAAIGADATSVDHLVAETGLPVQSVLAGLSRLEAAGAIRRLSGVTVQRA